MFGVAASPGNLAVWLPPQACRDMHTSVTVALDGLMVEAPQKKEQANAWENRAGNFLNKAQGTDVGKKTPKLQPCKAYEWLLGAHRQLQMVKEVGYSIFLLSDMELAALPCDRWPLLTVTSQGSDGWCAQSYPQYGLRAHVMVVSDASHRCWNDAQLAMGSCKLWWVAGVMQAVLNFDHGPWSNEYMARLAQIGLACACVCVRSFWFGHIGAESHIFLKTHSAPGGWKT